MKDKKESTQLKALKKRVTSLISFDKLLATKMKEHEKEQKEAEKLIKIKEEEYKNSKENKTSEFQEKRINESLGLIKLSLEIIESKRNKIHEDSAKKELIKLISQNHSMLGSLLSELGVEFDSKKQIFNLNERIRQMEQEMNDDKINHVQVSTYVENLKRKLRLDLESIGVHSSVEVGFNPNLFVSVDLFGQDARKPNSSYYKNEEDYLKDCESKDLRYKKCLENFETVVNSFNDTNILFSEENINKIIDVVNESMGEINYHQEIEVVNRYLKENNEFVESVPILQKVKMHFTTLPSSKSLDDAFKRFREGIY